MRAGSPTTETPLGGEDTAGEPGAPVGAEHSEGCFPDRPHGMLDVDRNHPIAEVQYRHRAQVGGRVRSVRIRPWGEILTLEAVLADQTAAITVAFLGRRSIAGVEPGGWLTVEGMVGERNEKLVILNPAYDLRPLAL